MCDRVKSYAELVDSFIACKRSAGYSYDGPSAWMARRMADFLDGHRHDGLLQRCAAEAFITSGSPDEAAETHNKRVSAVRQFALYLRMLGHDCFVPEPEEYRQRGGTGFSPRILSAAEMAAVIERADNAPLVWARPEDALEYRLILRLLWCCGLRLGEALSLRVSDVDLDIGAVTVRRAKYNRTRLLPLSDELVRYLEAYLASMGERDGAAFLFPDKDGNRRNRNVVSRRIQQIMLGAGVARPDDTAPRVHDIRHSYALAALAKMDAAGVGARSALPLLCAYMGHSDIVSTEYYLRLTEERHSEIHEKMADVYSLVYSGVVQDA